MNDGVARVDRIFNGMTEEATYQVFLRFPDGPWVHVNEGDAERLLIGLRWVMTQVNSDRASDQVVRQWPDRLVHWAPTPFVAACGAGKPNQSTAASSVWASVTCMDCSKLMTEKLQAD